MVALGRGTGMNGLPALLAVAGLLLGGCGPAIGRGVNMPAMRYPATFDGIPVRRLPWQKPLPHARRIAPLPWQTAAPDVRGRITPTLAISKALHAYPGLRQHTRRIYIQVARLIGGPPGNLLDAYVVEFVGGKGLVAAGGPSTGAPSVEVAVVIVDGETGSATVAKTVGNSPGP